MRRFAAAKQFAEAGAAKDEKEAAAKLLEEKQAQLAALQEPQQPEQEPAHEEKEEEEQAQPPEPEEDEQKIVSESETELEVEIGEALYLVSLETEVPMVFQTFPEEREIGRWDAESRRIVFDAVDAAAPEADAPIDWGALDFDAEP